MLDFIGISSLPSHTLLKDSLILQKKVLTFM